MTINGLSGLISKQAPTALDTLPLESFRGRRIAIDAFRWMYSQMYTARKIVLRRTTIETEEPNRADIRREWIGAALKFSCKLLHLGITPLWVFDGVHAESKVATQQRRKAKKVANRARIDGLYQSLAATTDERIRHDLITELRQVQAAAIHISSGDHELFRSTLQGVGLPCLQAPGEGERLCALLCIDGLAAATFTKDYDTVAYGCPLTITSIEKGNLVKLLRHERILQALQIDQRLLVEVCIAAGCDHNEGLPGVAATKALTLLRRHGRLEALPREHDVSQLNIQRCRQEFRYRPAQELLGDGAELALDVRPAALTEARAHLEAVGLDGLMEALLAGYTAVANPNGSVVDLGVGPVSRYQPGALRLNIMRACSPAT